MPPIKLLALAILIVIPGAVMMMQSMDIPAAVGVIYTILAIRFNDFLFSHFWR